MIVGFDASRIGLKHKTGVENYSEKLLYWFKKLDACDFVDGGKYHNGYILYTPKNQAIEMFDLPKNFTVREIPLARAWTQVRLPLELKKNKPNVLFIPSHVMPFMNYGVKTVVTIHDVAFKYFPDSYSQIARNYLDITTRFMVDKADQIITISETTKNDLIKFYEADENKIKVIHLGFDAPKKDTFHISEAKWEKIKDKFGIFRKYILFIGSIETKKNLTTLIKAFHEVLTSGQELQLVLAGSKGIGYELVAELIEKYNLKDRVIVTGYVNEEEKNHLLRGAELFTFLSRYEGFGLPILEAFYYEVPVIASKIPVFEELYKDAVVMVNPFDVSEIAETIINTLKNMRKRDSLAEKGKELLKNFSWEKCARETLNLLNSYEPDKNKIRKTY